MNETQKDQYDLAVDYLLNGDLDDPDQDPGEGVGCRAGYAYRESAGDDFDGMGGWELFRACTPSGWVSKDDHGCPVTIRGSSRGFAYVIDAMGQYDLEMTEKIRTDSCLPIDEGGPWTQESLQALAEVQRELDRRIRWPHQNIKSCNGE